MTYSKFTDLPSEDRRKAVEAILFASSEPLTAENLAEIFSFCADKPEGEKQKNQTDLSSENSQIPACDDFFARIIDEINSELTADKRPYEIIKSGGGYIFATRREYGEILQLTAKYRFRKKLSQASLETLAIIAWQQPVTKPEIEQIRGINSSEIVNSLLDKELIGISGKKDLPGRPVAYSTTQKFLQTFGLNSIEELPKLREIDEILADSERSSAAQENVTFEIPQETSTEDTQN